VNEQVSAEPDRKSAFGSFLILRAVPAAGAAAVITFSANHATIIGQLVFMTFGFVMAPIMLITAFGSGFASRVRIAFTVSAIAAVTAAAITSALIGPSNSGTPAEALRSFTLILGIWAAVAGLSELLAGWFHDKKNEAREMFILGGFTAALALAELLLPLNEIYAVGLFGAYGALVAVFSAIAGFSVGLSRPAKQKGKS